MRWRWLPNFLTIARIVLVPFLFWAILDQRSSTAFVLFFLAGVSDYADGKLARHFQWQTRFGSLVDPLADKLLFAAVFVALMLQAKIALWFGILVLLRDAVIVVGATIYNFTIERLVGAASYLGKLNTLVLGCYVLLVLAKAAGAAVADLVLTVACLVSVGLLLLSGTHYVWHWAQRARRRSIDD